MLKVVHINREAQPQKSDPVKELEDILWEKWDARAKAEAKKMFPGVEFEEDNKLNPSA